LTEGAQTTPGGWSVSDIRPKAAGSGIPTKDQVQGILDHALKLMFMESESSLYEEMAKIVIALFPVEQITIWMIDPDGRQRPKVALGYPPDMEHEIMSLSHIEDYDQEMIKVANRVSPMSYFVPAEMKRHLGWEVDLESIGKREALAKPRSSQESWHDMDFLRVNILSRGGKPTGSIVISKTTDDRIPSMETVRAIEIFSTTCSAALEVVRQRESKAAIADAAEGRSTQISRILSFAREVIALEDPDKLFDSVLKILRELFGFQRGSISLLDEKGDAFRYVALMGYPPQDTEYAKTIQIPADAHKFFVQSEFLIGHDAYYIPAEQLPYDKLLWEVYSPDDFMELKKRKDEPRPYPGAWHVQDNLAFALHDKQGHVIGLLCPDNPSDGKTPSLETIDGMGIFTSLVSIALENAKYYSETIRAKKDIDVLNKLLFRDVSRMNSEVREYLDEALSPNLTREQRLTCIKGASQMIDTIIDLIQKVRRISSIRLLSSSDLLRIDLVDAIKGQMARMPNLFPDKKIREAYGSMPSNCYVLANDLIGEMFNSIIKNAIVHNYSDEAEISVSIEGAMDEHKKKALWDISISDNGQGIPDERKVSIFDLASQIDESMDAIGVSLSMVKSIVTLYGGSIWVEDRVPSDRSKGSTFHIIIPAA